MDDEYDLSKVPFFTDYQQPDYTAFENLNDDPTNIKTSDVDPLDVFKLKQNLRQIAKTMTRIEQLLTDQLQGARQKRTFWTQEEHFQFLKYVQKYGRSNIKEVSKCMTGVRSVQQVRTHAQKYFEKLDKYNLEAHNTINSFVKQIQQEITNRCLQFERILSQSINNLSREQLVLNLLTNHLQVIDPIISAQISPTAVPLPLICLSNAQKVLRQIYTDIPYGSYYVTSSQELQALVLLAVSGQFQAHLQQSTGFVQLVYVDSNELLIEATTPQAKFNLSSIDFDVDQIEFAQLNINPFLKYCAGFVTANLNNRQFLFDFLFVVQLCLKQIQAVSDPFDFVVQRVAEQIAKTADDVCCYVFCYCALQAFKGIR
ncbi:Myb-like_DNA-binding domain-containing protein [Hexamita inflata]|uniref:Myb-like DNA-binding domain-containing protein n=1 Tax=Hexamita inflata TaxID=28002 RepID=A0AA86NH83_9EUKA|nr:Myb-like DNA-binding domain-containing protein [Hexamita inflata]CAI9919034.1 Myb-like DNA-binding domain-containing protein [Hexamita inflata]CAI9973977.1 Myb-like DNA-binding domain-containing protein [Hexamita inflata]